MELFWRGGFFSLSAQAGEIGPEFAKRFSFS